MLSAARTAAYFCNILADPPHQPDASDIDYPSRRRKEVRDSAIAFLNRDIQNLRPECRTCSGRWILLLYPQARVKYKIKKKQNKSTRAQFDSQFWTANVNPSDRYSLSLPGTLRHRISPLDKTYDNLTIAGDWTDCGFNEGCVEAAVMSGRLAAHAISGFPRLEEIVGYDHP